MRHAATHIIRDKESRRTISVKDTIHIPGIELGFKRPVLFERHAVGVSTEPAGRRQGPPSKQARVMNQRHSQGQTYERLSV